MSGAKRSATEAGLGQDQGAEKKARTVEAIQTELKHLSARRNLVEWELFNHDDMQEKRRQNGGELLLSVLDCIGKEDAVFLRRFCTERQMQITMMPGSTSEYPEATTVSMACEDGFRVRADIGLRAGLEDEWLIRVSTDKWAIRWIEEKDDLEKRQEKVRKIAASEGYDDETTEFLLLLMTLDYVVGATHQRDHLLSVFPESRVPLGPCTFEEAVSHDMPEYSPANKRCWHCYDTGKTVPSVRDCLTCGNPACKPCLDNAGDDACSWCEGNMLFQ
jgi:hypothetical protein